MKKVIGLLMATALFVAASSIFACPGSKNKGETKETRTQTEIPAKA